MNKNLNILFNLIKNLNMLFNLMKLLITQNKKENFEFFKSRLEKEFPKGLMFVYSGIDFYIKDFTSCEEEFNNELDFNEDKIYVICEYYDAEAKIWHEKVMHEDFVRNRFEQFKRIVGD